MKQKIQYSCKRRKDVVTFLAVAMFSVIVAFELYLIIVLPVQLARKNSMLRYVEKQRMLLHADALREQVYRSMCMGQGPGGEIMLVMGSLDVMAIYVRNNQESLNPEQVYELRTMLNRFQIVADSWRRGQFRIHENLIDRKPLSEALRKKLGE